MAHEGIFATSDEILVKAGANYDIGITEARINALCLQAESKINVMIRYNFSDNYATLNADTKHILSETASNLVAIYIISYNMSVYSSRVEAETMLDVCWANYKDNIKELKDLKKRKFIVSS